MEMTINVLDGRMVVDAANTQDAIKYLNNIEDIEIYKAMGFILFRNNVRECFAEILENYGSVEIVKKVVDYITKQPEPVIGGLTETDMIEIRDRYGDEVAFVVRDMLTGKNERWEYRGVRSAMGG